MWVDQMLSLLCAWLWLNNPVFSFNFSIMCKYMHICTMITRKICTT